MGLAIAGVHNGGTTTVLKIDVTPDGQRLFAIGNFLTVDGQTNDQVVALDLGGASAAPRQLADHLLQRRPAPAASTPTCATSTSRPTAPTSSSRPPAPTAAPPTSCDTIARFEVGAIGTNVQPTWVDYTGGDTSYAVAVTGEAVYVGGHLRWVNNPFAATPPAPAPCPARASPPSTRPTACRSRGTRAAPAASACSTCSPRPPACGSAATPTASATTSSTAASRSSRSRAAPPLPDNQRGRLPGRAYLLGAGTTNDVAGRTFDGDTAGAAAAVPNGGINWQSSAAR